MIDLFILGICVIISFFVVLFSTPWIIRYLKRIELVAIDRHKQDQPIVATSGGVAVMVGIFIGLMLYIFFKTFLSENGNEDLTLLFASITTILLITFVGFVDDLLRRERSEKKPGGLRQWQKPLMTLGAAIPLIAINAGTSTMAFPLVGRVDLGLIYPLLFVPIGVLVASNMVNLLAGFNGLEAGLGLINFGMLSIYSYVNGSDLGFIISMISFVSLLAFFRYNKVPAKLLPGDSLTYLIGALMAVVAIVGNIERAAIIISIPFAIEFFLKLRGKFKKQSYGFIKEGKIYSMYDKIYSIPHIFTRKGKYTEKQVVVFTMLIQLFFASLIWFV